MKKDNRFLYGGLAILTVVSIVAFNKKPKQENPPEQSNNPQAAAPPKPIAPNKSLILKNGSRGIEVSELQKMLEISADGIFGPGTEKALLAIKGVKQISLDEAAKMPNRNNNPFSVGDKLMSNNLKGCQTYKGIEKANKTYYTNWDKENLVGYGQQVGTIKSMNQTKTVYSVYADAWLGTKVVFVKAIDVKKY